MAAILRAPVLLLCLGIIFNESSDMLSQHFPSYSAGCSRSRKDQTSFVCALSGRVFVYESSLHRNSLLSLLSCIHQALCSSFSLKLLSPLLETMCVSLSLKVFFESHRLQKVLILNCSRRVLGERNSNSLDEVLYRIKGGKHK